MRTTRELRERIEAAARASGRSLVQEVEYRVEQSFERESIAETTKAALDNDKIDSYAAGIPMSRLGDLARWIERARQLTGDPELPFEVARAIYRGARRDRITPEEFWSRKLRELGIDPDAPLPPPSTDEQSEK
jgi:hypothetical protein